jgi:hypothetical protein
MPQDAHTMRGPNHGIGASSPSSSSSAMTSPPYRWSNLAEFAFVIHRSLNHLQRAVHNQCHLDLCRQHFKVATLGCFHQQRCRTLPIPAPSVSASWRQSSSRRNYDTWLRVVVLAQA